MKISKICFLLILLVVFSAPLPAYEKDRKATYDRIHESGTLRCGYILFEPYVEKDLATGQMSGLVVDYMNEIGKKNGLKIDWAEEVNIDQVVPALEYGRIDAFCVPCTPDLTWAERLEFASGIGATPYFIYTRSDNDMTLEQLKKAQFVTVDGFALTGITHQSFPDAHYASLPQTTSMAEMYEQLRYKKADALINDPLSASLYIRNNPDIIKKFSEKPVVSMRMSLISQKGDETMRDFMRQIFDAAIPKNEKLLKDLMKKYKVPEDGLLLSDRCETFTTLENGWDICGTSKTIEFSE